MNKKILGVDVDLTIVDTLTPWVEWYEQQTNHNISDKLNSLDYNIELLMNEHPTPLDFWKNRELYDNLKPFKESINVLDSLKEKYDIIFISSCFKEHERSKENFLNKYFPFHSEFISTSEKGKINCDVMIDDYYKNLDMFEGKNCIKLLAKTIINENCSKYTPMTWNEILEILK